MRSEWKKIIVHSTLVHVKELQTVKINSQPSSMAPSLSLDIALEHQTTAINHLEAMLQRLDCGI